MMISFLMIFQVIWMMKCPCGMLMIFETANNYRKDAPRIVEYDFWIYSDYIMVFSIQTTLWNMIFLSNFRSKFNNCRTAKSIIMRNCQYPVRQIWKKHFCFSGQNTFPKKQVRKRTFRKIKKKNYEKKNYFKQHRKSYILRKTIILQKKVIIYNKTYL